MLVGLVDHLREVANHPGWRFACSKCSGWRISIFHVRERRRSTVGARVGTRTAPIRRRVRRIRLRVGVLRAIEPGNLSFLFEHLARGTPAEGAHLDIVEEPVRVECGACGVSEVPSFTWECPRCKGSGVSVTGGDSLSILSLDVDT